MVGALGGRARVCAAKRATMAMRNVERIVGEEVGEICLYSTEGLYIPKHDAPCTL